MVDTPEDLPEDIPLLHRAGETLTGAMRSQRRLAGTSIAAMPMAEAERFTADAGTTAALDITAADLGSASACTRHSDMPLGSVIPPDFTTSTAPGSTIPVALFPTDIKLDGLAALTAATSY